MGAEYNEAIIKDPELKMADKEIKTAAEAIFNQAAYDHGHAGYSGSFAEKLGAGVDIHRDKEFDHETAARQYVDDKLDSDKWGPADVVPIKGVGWYVGGWCSS